MGLGTGVVSAYLISPRLPKLRQWITRRLPPVWKEKLQPALARLRVALKGWLKAQLRLMGITFCIVTVGFLILGIPYAPFSALGVALVDAVPLLGTGAVLLPWALVELLQGQTLRGVGLLVTYGGSLLVRTVLEPKLVGRHLGLDPLLTLVFLYVGYRFWGILGMIFAPMAAAAAKSITETVG
jgi:sporulation integral membrane protein YtvI